MAKLVRILLLGTAGLVALVGFWFLLPNRLFYQHKRPTRFGRFANRIAALTSARLPSPAWYVALEVPGRRSAVPHRTALVLADVDGERYAVSMLGERSEWLRNVRANGGAAVVLHRNSRQDVYLDEVPAHERAPILRAYLQRALGGRPHFPIARSAPLEEFARIAADYPVLRVRPASIESAVRA
jgi:deazaflavin-dependent oxidoreductase (nitroreductase family)